MFFLYSESVQGPFTFDTQSLKPIITIFQDFRQSSIETASALQLCHCRGKQGF